MEKFKDCYFKKEGKVFIFGNSKIERKILIGNGSFYTISFYDKENKKEWVENKNFKKIFVDFSYENLTEFNMLGLSFQALLLKNFKTKIENEFGKEVFNIIFHLIETNSKTEIKRIYIIYPQLSIIVIQSEILSSNYPAGDFYKERENVLERLNIKKEICYKGRVVEFFTRTDITNQLVKEEFLHYSDNPLYLRGNLIFLNDKKDDCGIFILKEYFVSSDLRLEVKSDFEINHNELKVMGWGIRPEELGNLKWRKSYKIAIGFYKGKEEPNGILKLKEYQMAKYNFVPKRDYMIMANPWGDGNVYKNLCENFVLKEIESCHKFGITHYQIDDGWQKGGKAIDVLTNKRINKDFWKINEKIFPNSFYKISQKAKELGITLGLWFIPDRNCQYKEYLKDTEIILDFYKKFGIKVFKLDAINIQTKDAEENFELFLKEIYKKSKGKIIFNFDVTGSIDRRPGYFYLLEYGNIFLENRYTNIRNDVIEKKYYPYKTLRNLWQLAKYVLPQKLQIEILNISLNKNQYPENDILAPFNYSWDYCFAITFFSNPLFWGEISQFPEDSLKILKPLIKLHKKCRYEIFSSYILPIGNVPNGYNWTGFISYPGKNVKNFYILIFRENHPSKIYEFYIDFIEKSDFSILYSSCKCDFSFYKNFLKINLEKPNSFALLKSKIY